MKVLLYPIWLLYRIWFYLLMLVPIIVLFPFIFVSILSEKTYPLFFKIARFWAKVILIGMGFRYSIEGDEIFEDGKSYMLVANHTSMTDIMLMLIAVKNHPFVFVGKKELVKIPIFGFIYKRVCILVDRKSSKSRYEVFERAPENQGFDRRRDRQGERQTRQSREGDRGSPLQMRRKMTLPARRNNGK
jgi:1-acyl-sn-glycerol-3-phosphate acyltransferase